MAKHNDARAPCFVSRTGLRWRWGVSSNDFGQDWRKKRTVMSDEPSDGDLNGHADGRETKSKGIHPEFIFHCTEA